MGICLHKPLCIKCYNETRVTPWEKQPAKERQWDREKVCCWCDWKRRSFKWRRITMPPPEDCPYYLEHMLVMSEKDRKEREG